MFFELFLFAPTICCINCQFYRYINSYYLLQCYQLVKFTIKCVEKCMYKLNNLKQKFEYILK